ncbi:MAG: hypothetical protein LBE36_09015 [Flavobacteriaceae bacterium]|jgi:hypothetical protein|nr:hypothetical protein [Flavobacteriaceae bacterium]
MRKILIIFGVFILLCFGIEQKRHFYALSDDKYVTVWKRWGDICYIIPGKYYGITVPDNYVKTSNVSYVGIIYYDGKIIVDGGAECQFINSSPNNMIYNYKDNEQENDSLFTEKRGYYYYYKKNFNVITVDIRYPYATDRYGKKL